MTIAHWCLFAAGLLHIVSRFPMGFAQSREGSGYDNKNPREQQARLTGWGRRAKGVHENQIESFPLFAAGVLVALTQAPRSTTIDILALTYIAARVAFASFYLADIAALRSLVWMVGYGVSLALLASPAWVK
jgi:uncharacterized MAPEG superfamily protein